MAESSGTCLSTVRAQLNLNLHPSRSGDTRLGIQEELNDLIMKYHETYGGVVLAYSDVVLKEKKAKILDGINPHFRINLSATLLLFAPKVGSILDGVVHKTGADYIGVHTLGVFNAAIRGEEFVEQFECDEEWMNPVHYSREDEEHQIKVGSRVRVVVTAIRVEMDNHIVIDAAINIPGTGCIDWLRRKHERLTAKPMEEASSKKKKKRKEREEAAEEPISRGPGDPSSPAKKKRKKGVVAERAAKVEEEENGRDVELQVKRKKKKGKAVDAGEGVEERGEMPENGGGGGEGSSGKAIRGGRGGFGKEYGSAQRGGPREGGLANGEEGSHQATNNKKERKHAKEQEFSKGTDQLLVEDSRYADKPVSKKEKASTTPEKGGAVGGFRTPQAKASVRKGDEDRGDEFQQAGRHRDGAASPGAEEGNTTRDKERRSKYKEDGTRKADGVQKGREEHRGPSSTVAEQANGGAAGPSGKQAEGKKSMQKTKRQKER